MATAEAETATAVALTQHRWSGLVLLSGFFFFELITFSIKVMCGFSDITPRNTAEEPCKDWVFGSYVLQMVINILVAIGVFLRWWKSERQSLKRFVKNGHAWILLLSWVLLVVADGVAAAHAAVWQQTVVDAFGYGFNIIIWVQLNGEWNDGDTERAAPSTRTIVPRLVFAFLQVLFSSLIGTYLVWFMSRDAKITPAALNEIAEINVLIQTARIAIASITGQHLIGGRPGGSSGPAVEQMAATAPLPANDNVRNTNNTAEDGRLLQRQAQQKRYAHVPFVVCCALYAVAFVTAAMQNRAAFSTKWDGDVNLGVLFLAVQLLFCIVLLGCWIKYNVEIVARARAAHFPFELLVAIAYCCSLFWDAVTVSEGLSGNAILRLLPAIADSMLYLCLAIVWLFIPSHLLSGTMFLLQIGVLIACQASLTACYFIFRSDHLRSANDAAKLVTEYLAMFQLLSWAAAVATLPVASPVDGDVELGNVRAGGIETRNPVHANAGVPVPAPATPAAPPAAAAGAAGAAGAAAGVAEGASRSSPPPPPRRSKKAPSGP